MDEPLDGYVGSSAGYQGALVTFTPDPNGLALDDCSNPQHKPFNQYLITDGVPCAISYHGSDSNFVEQMRQSANWEISTPPLPILPRTQNITNANGSSVSPAHIINSVPWPGLLFDLSNGLPASNGAFGTRTITHSLLGVNVTAPIAIFYPATGTEHPYGGPTGWSYPGPTNPLVAKSEVQTPNWMYYYNQIVPPPCAVFYAPSPANTNRGAAYYHGEDYIWLHNAHGIMQTMIFRKDQNGALAYAGKETVRGVDTYARLLKHELAHKRCYEFIHRAGANPAEEDEDGDRVPDVWEDAVGLKHTGDFALDSTSFQYFSDYPEGEGDSEAFARLYEEGVFGPMGSDWADDGLQKAPIPAPNVCTRTVVYALNGFSYTQVVSLSDLEGTQVTNLP